MSIPKCASELYPKTSARVEATFREPGFLKCFFLAQECHIDLVPMQWQTLLHLLRWNYRGHKGIHLEHDCVIEVIEACYLQSACRDVEWKLAVIHGTGEDDDIVCCHENF